MATQLNGFETMPTVIADQATRRSPLPGIAVDEMPRERLARQGSEALKDQELLAILLGTGYRGQNVLDLAHAILDIHPKEALMEMDL